MTEEMRIFYLHDINRLCNHHPMCPAINWSHAYLPYRRGTVKKRKTAEHSMVNIEDDVFPSSLCVMHTRPNSSFKREPAATSRNVHDAPGITDRGKKLCRELSIDRQSKLEEKMTREGWREEEKKHITDLQSVRPQVEWSWWKYCHRRLLATLWSAWFLSVRIKCPGASPKLEGCDSRRCRCWRAFF